MPPTILKNATGDVPELWFYTEFGPWEDTISANAVRLALQAVNSRKITIHINSDGGDVIEAMAVYNLLKHHDSKKTVLIDGLAASCASWVAQVGDTIRCAQNGLLMIHNPSSVAWGDAEAFRRQADVLDQVKQSIAGVYASRTGKLTVEQVSDAMTKETWYSAAEALEAGLIDEIDPNKSITMQLDHRKFRNAPDWVKNRTGDWRRALLERRQELNELAAD